MKKPLFNPIYQFENALGLINHFQTAYASRTKNMRIKLIPCLLAMHANYFILGLTMIFCISIQGQNNLDIDGDAKITGKLDLADNQFNLIIGAYAGINTTSSFNTFLGTSTGFSNTTGLLNTFVGYNAGLFTTSGEQNTFIGYAGLGNQTGEKNTFVGVGAGNTANSNHNSFFGFEAGTNSTNGTDNVFVGSRAGGQNQSGSYNTYIGRQAGDNGISGSYVTAIGFRSGRLNTAGANTFVGAYSGEANTSGANNTFLGTSSGFKTNTGGGNTFVGNTAGFENTNGASNVYIGSAAGRSSTNGVFNTFVGTEAGRNATSGQNNVFMGWHAGFGSGSGSDNVHIGLAAGALTKGSQNVFIGSTAGVGITSNANNVAIGFEADFTGNYTNATVIGAGASCNAHNKVRIGNTNVQVIEGQVSFSAASDFRLKKDIVNCEQGLVFINALRPVQYHWKKGHGDKLYTGFIAQEVEQVAAKHQFDFSAIKSPQNESDYYSLSYAEFVVPLVKAVQELSEQNSALLQRIKILEQYNEKVVTQASLSHIHD